VRQAAERPVADAETPVKVRRPRGAARTATTASLATRSEAARKRRRHMLLTTPVDPEEYTGAVFAVRGSTMVALLAGRPHSEVRAALGGGGVECNDGVTVTGVTRRGHGALIEVSCVSCGTAESFSTTGERVDRPLGRGRPVNTDALRAAANALLAGASTSQIRRVLASIPTMAAPADSTIQRFSVMVFEAATDVGRASVTAAMDRAVEEAANGGRFDAAFDGGWSHRRQGAANWVIVVNSTHNTIVDLEALVMGRERYEAGDDDDDEEGTYQTVTEGSYFGTSKAMESRGLAEIAKRLAARPDVCAALTGLCGDEDGGLAKSLREQGILSHLRVLVDPGHYAKGRVKEAESIIAQVKNKSLYKDLPGRVKKWLMYGMTKGNTTVRESKYRDVDRAVAEYRDLLGFSVRHFTATECFPACPCRRKTVVSAGDSCPEKPAAKMVFDPQLVKGLADMFRRASRRAPDVVHGTNSCLAESAHNRRCLLTPKTRCFWVTWVGRCWASAALLNDGVEKTCGAVYARLGLSPTDDEVKMWRREDAERERRRERDKNKRKRDAISALRRKAARKKPVAGAHLYGASAHEADAEEPAGPDAPKKKKRKKQVSRHEMLLDIERHGDESTYTMCPYCKKPFEKGARLRAHYKYKKKGGQLGPCAQKNADAQK
jgi:hypothetical protein